MEAPNKIYLSPKSFEIGEKFNDLLTTMAEGDIEYTRTDSFIEKACEYLMEYEFNDSPTIADRRKRVDEFINYMKGE